MAKWILKAAVQKTISILPFKQQINYFLQRNITKAVQLSEEHFDWKVGHAKDHINHFTANGGSIENKIVFELGTGWYPIIPIAMFLNGAKKVISYDIQSWLTKETILTAIEKLIEANQQNQLPKELGRNGGKRWEVLKLIVAEKSALGLEEIKTRLHLETRVQDARASGLVNGSVDLICSNNTFEHIYKDVLQGILIEFKRVLKPGGLMSHFIDLTDHFAHFDKNITIFNYLKFSKTEWEIIDNDIQPQNRLRWKEYKEIYHKIGLDCSEKLVRSGSVAELNKISLHADYLKFEAKELAITHGYLCS